MIINLTNLAVTFFAALASILHMSFRQKTYMDLMYMCYFLFSLLSYVVDDNPIWSTIDTSTGINGMSGFLTGVFVIFLTLCEQIIVLSWNKTGAGYRRSVRLRFIMNSLALVIISFLFFYKTFPEITINYWFLERRADVIGEVYLCVYVLICFFGQGDVFSVAIRNIRWKYRLTVLEKIMVVLISGSGLIIAYAILRFISVVFQNGSNEINQISWLLGNCGSLISIIGVSLPLAIFIFNKFIRKIRAAYVLFRLKHLWKTLTAPHPELILQLPQKEKASLEYKAQRRIIEIYDVQRIQTRYKDDLLYSQDKPDITKHLQRFTSIIAKIEKNQ